MFILLGYKISYTQFVGIFSICLRSIVRNTRGAQIQRQVAMASKFCAVTSNFWVLSIELLSCHPSGCLQFGGGYFIFGVRGDAVG
jgi:hypothetical protein